MTVNKRILIKDKCSDKNAIEKNNTKKQCGEGRPLWEVTLEQTPGSAMQR